MIEHSEIFKQVSFLNEKIVDDHEFSFSSIGDEFDFEIGITGNGSPKTYIDYEDSDLIFESSQNFY